MTVTYNSGTDTVTLSGTESSPDTLSAIVTAVANSSKATKVGDGSYFFSFAVLDGSAGFIEFAVETMTVMTNVRWDKNGASGGAIFRERSIVRHEGTGQGSGGTIAANTGYKFIARRDRAGVNPQFIMAANSRYDFFTCEYSPMNTPSYDITGLDLETIGTNSDPTVASSVKVYAATGSAIDNLRVFSRASKPCEFQARDGTFTNLRLESAAISNSPDAGLSLNLVTPVFDFLGTATNLSFNFNNTGSVNLIDPSFPAGAWTGDYTGISTGFRNDPGCIVNVIFTDTLSFLVGTTGQAMKVRHTRNDGVTIDNTASGGGLVSGVQMLSSYRNGSGFGSGNASPSGTYTWSAKARKYDYAVAGGSDLIFSATAFGAPRSATTQLSSVAHLTITESAAAALTGIALTAAGSTGGTLTVSASHSLQDIWHFYRQFIAAFANFGSDDTWSFDGSTLYVGAWDVVVTGSGVVLSGARLVTSSTLTFSSGGAPSAMLIYQTSTATSVPLTAPNLIDGTRVQIFDVAASTELSNVLVAGGAGYVSRFNWVTDKAIRIRATFTDGMSSKVPVEGTGLLTAVGATFLNAQIDDTVYIENAIDGSAVAEFTGDYPNVQVDVSDMDGVTSVQRLYAWWMFNLTSSSGISAFFGGLVADDVVNYRIVTGLLNLTLDNTETLPVQVVGGRLYRDDGSTVISPTSGSIQLDPDKVYVVNGDGAAAAAVWNYVLTGSTTASDLLQLSSAIKAKTDALPPDPASITALDALPVGLTPTQAVQLDEVHKLQGLDIAAPLVVTAVTRSAGAIEQQITEAGGTVTVERQ